MESSKQLIFKNHSGTILEYFHVYYDYDKKPPDCILYYSSEKCQFLMHKDIFSQTKFMREILKSAKENCCETLEILCPCTEKELIHLSYFLYYGEIDCENEDESINIRENLIKIFGFPNNISLTDRFQAKG